MIRRPLLWAAGNSRLQQTITKNPITSKAAHRFVAGERIEQALDAAAHLNGDGIGGILDLLGEGVTDRPTRCRPSRSTSRRPRQSPAAGWTPRSPSNCPSWARRWTATPA
jgi:proline dehydrogenase